MSEKLLQKQLTCDSQTFIATLLLDPSISNFPWIKRRSLKVSDCSPVNKKYELNLRRRERNKKILYGPKKRFLFSCKIHTANIACKEPLYYFFSDLSSFKTYFCRRRLERIQMSKQGLRLERAQRRKKQTDSRTHRVTYALMEFMQISISKK